MDVEDEGREEGEGGGGGGDSWIKPGAKRVAKTTADLKKSPLVQTSHLYLTTMTTAEKKQHKAAAMASWNHYPGQRARPQPEHLDSTNFICFCF